MTPFKLVWRNLMRRPLRSTLTILSLMIAVLLICGLRSLITTINAGVSHADNRRLAVMSSTGLFVQLPMKYQAAMERVPGVELTTKFQWFGGYFRSMKGGFFGQFAIDPETLFEMYPECKAPPEQQAAFKQNRTSCIIGDMLAQKYGWKVGDTVPLLSSLHPHPDGRAWEFQVAAIYHSDLPNFDNQTLFFHWDYFEETLKQGGITPGVGVYSIRVKPGADVARVIADVEDTFRDSDQLVDCQTESEFQRQFVTMFGNIPLFVGWIGSGVVIAILLACINTMLMSMREQTVDIGIMKAQGFTDGAMFRLLIAQALFLCVFGGSLGMLMAWATEGPVGALLGTNFPGFAIATETYLFAGLVTLGLGVLAGVVPAWRARQLRCVDAMRGTD